MVSVEMAAALSISVMTIVSMISQYSSGFYVFSVLLLFLWFQDACIVSMEMAATLSVTPMTIASLFSECPYGFYGDGCHPVCDSHDYCVYVFRLSLWFLWRWLPPCL